MDCRIHKNTSQLTEYSANIIIDECFYSRAALLSLLKSPVSPLNSYAFKNANEFIKWRASYTGKINSLIIHIHDQMNMMNEEIVHFFVKDIGALKLDSSKIIVVSDAIAKLELIFAKEFNIINFLDGRGGMDILKLQIKECVEVHKTGAITVPKFKKSLHSAPVRRLRTRGLSPAELIAVTNVFTGKGVKESSKDYRGHYKTLYNQRMSAIRKLGMHTVQDLIKYRHLISALYLTENCVVKNNYSDIFC